MNKTDTHYNRQIYLLNIASGKPLGLFQIQRSATEIVTGCAAMIRKRFEVIFIFFFNEPTVLRRSRRVSETKSPEYAKTLPS